MTIQTKIILLVDDDLDDQEMLEETFLQLEENAAIHTVSSGHELIEYLINCEWAEMPGLIVLDYNMPKMNGGEVLSYLSSNKQYRHIPVVVWSTTDSSVYKTECEEKGAKLYLCKPNNRKYLEITAIHMLRYLKKSSEKSRRT